MKHGIALILILATLVGSASVAHAHQIIEAKGQVKLKRENSDYRPTRLGERLIENDKLWPAQGATVKVLCNDSTVWRVPSGQPAGLNQGCPKSLIGSRFRPVKLCPRPGGNNLQIPYTLSPRMTYLLNDRPTFRWHEVAGATRYTVSLQGPGGVEWQTEVNSTEVVYPSSASPLEWGVKYLLTVKADNGSSSLEGAGANLGFEILKEDEVKEVRDKAATIAASTDLTEEVKALALAELYSNKYLNADAIVTLEALVKKGSQTAFVYQRLGDLYGGIGLNLLAEARYSKALELFTAAQDRDSLTETREKLSTLKLNENRAPNISQILTPTDLPPDLPQQ